MFQEKSDSSFLKKFYGHNLDNLMKLRQKREKIAANYYNSASTLRKFSRSSLELQSTKPKPDRYSVGRPASQKKMFKQLSNQLAEIQQSIATLSKKGAKKTTRHSLKVMTEPTEDPKSKIYRQVLNQIDQIKQKRKGLVQPKAQSKQQPRVAPSPQETTMFYGVDFIDGVQFKIKIKIEAGKYYLMAKNAHAKLMLEMGAQEYMKLHQSLFKGNPCGIFNHLTINNNQLILGIGHKKQSKLFKTYLNYY